MKVFEWLRHFFLDIIPEGCHEHLKRNYYRWQISRRAFKSDEIEYQHLHQFVSPGEWVIDVGANIGHYTLQLSQLVGARGHVFAFEPIYETFRLLASNSRYFAYKNVTLLNVAASDECKIVKMMVPRYENCSRLNFYESRIVSQEAGANIYHVLAIPIDSLEIPSRVGFAKIDVEGHELEVCRGMKKLISRDRPTLIVEGERAGSFLKKLGYKCERAKGSPNIVYRHTSDRFR